MQVIPAIDILDGRVVRLRRGDFDEVTVYADDPADVARRWREQGADLVHVVDLDGARTGTPDRALVRRLAGTGVPFQIGGGIRSAASAVAAMEAGAARVVVGSATVAEGDELVSIVDAVGSEAVVAALDVRGGRARGSGWLDDGLPMAAAVGRVTGAGVGRALVTGIERDGAMTGPDLGLLGAVRRLAPGLAIIASGGVGSLEDIAALAARDVEAVVVGRALYEGRFRLADAVTTAR